MRASRVWISLLMCGFIVAAAHGAECRVVYLTGSTYYVDAGHDAGIVVGDELELWRDGVGVGRLVVRHLASSRAACDVLEGPEPVIGDVVHFTPRAVHGNEPLAEGSRPIRSASAVYGAVSLQQQLYIERSGYGEDLYRPALEARIEGRSVGGHPVDVLVDARAHRSIRSESENESRTRVYRLEATWRFRADRLRLRVGRQRQPSLPSLGTFDGMSLEFGTGRGLSYGVAAALQPEPGNLSVSSDVFESAAHIGSSGELGPGRWSALLAAVGSYESSEISREYLLVRGRYRDAGWSLSAVQELDIYRGWRADLEGSGLDATSHFLSLRRRLHRRASVHLGLDSRRSVRVYRYRETPETEFDDSYRNGVWGGLQWSAWRGATVSLRLRTRNSSGAGSMDSQTLQLQRVPLWRIPMRLELRTTRYDNPYVEGWLSTIGVESSPGEFSGRIEAGLRNDSPKLAALGGEDAWWLTLEGDYRIGANWSTTLSWDHFGGADDSRETVYSALRCRF